MSFAQSAVQLYGLGRRRLGSWVCFLGSYHVNVELRYAQDVALCVRDNGVGIDQAVIGRGRQGHFGLQGMRERAARIGGKLTLVSSAASGTEIKLVVPGEIVFRA